MMVRRERWEIDESGAASDAILRVNTGDPKLHNTRVITASPSGKIHSADDA